MTQSLNERFNGTRIAQLAECLSRTTPLGWVAAYFAPRYGLLVAENVRERLDGAGIPAFSQAGKIAIIAPHQLLPHRLAQSSQRSGYRTSNESMVAVQGLDERLDGPWGAQPSQSLSRLSCNIRPALQTVYGCKSLDQGLDGPQVAELAESLGCCAYLPSARLPELGLIRQHKV